MFDTLFYLSACQNKLDAAPRPATTGPHVKLLRNRVVLTIRFVTSQASTLPLHHHPKLQCACDLSNFVAHDALAPYKK